MVEDKKVKIISFICYVIISISILVICNECGVFSGFSSNSSSKYYKKIYLDIGESSLLDPNVVDVKTVKIENSNSDVATIDEDGKIEAKAKGTTVITIKDENNNVVKRIEIVVDTDIKKEDPTPTPSPDPIDDPVNQRPSEQTPTDKIVSSTNISIINNKPTIAVGSTLKLNAKIEPINTTDKIITWSTSDSSIATINNEGVVVGIKVGTATITAKNGNVSTTVQVTITPIVVKSIELNKKSTTLVVDGSETITATIYPSNATNNDITWASSDESIVTVNNGTIIGKNVGKAVVTAKCGEKYASVNVTVNKKPASPIAVTSVSLSKSSLSILIGNSTSITATVKPDNATNKAVTWASSDNSIATVNNGVITAKNIGTATITATSGGKSATVKVTVDPIEVTSIKLNKTSTSIVQDSSETITATISPANATNKTITWTSSDSSIATVSNGKITAKKVGTAKITAKCGSKSAAVTVKVTPVLATSVTLNKTSTNMIIGNSETFKATIKPSNTTNKTVKWKSSDTSIATVDQNGLVTAVSAGSVKITATIDSVSATVNIKVLANTADVIKAYFLNVQNASNMVETQSNGLAVILKTVDNKYILFDTGSKDTGTNANIYNQLKSVQGKDNVVIDYLIISHMHTDHYGNALTTIQNDKIKVKNLIVKYEELMFDIYANQKKAFKNIVNAAIADGAKIYLSPNATDSKIQSIMGKSITYTKLSEGQKIKLDNYVSMYLYNVDDVYKNIDKSKCVNGRALHYTSRYNESLNFYKTSNNKYVYYDYSKYPTGTLQLSDTLSPVKDSKYFAYIDEDEVNVCRNNPNSLTAMISVKTSGANKIIYLSGDVENSGYDIIPTKVSGYTDKVYGNGSNILYQDVKFDINKKQFTSPISIKLPSETKTAKTIATSETFSNKLKHIVIYQQSHHGLNNAKDAIDILGLNRTGVYAISSTSTKRETASTITSRISYYYSLGNIPADHKLITGNGKTGIKCNIAYNLKYQCIDY